MERRYDICTSLGWFCGTACSMSHYGLRSHSGPFDWCFSDFLSVLKMIETDFSDFMKKENLVVDKNDYKVFRDIKYGFCYNHDISHDFELEFSSIYEKYMRRVERFMHDIKNSTCFIRAVKSEREILFIEENEDYILSTIRKANSANNIIFLLLKDMRSLSVHCKFQWFRLGISKYSGQSYALRTMFESSDSFSAFCNANILSDEVLKHNKEFDRENLSLNNKLDILIGRLNKENHDIFLVLKEYFPDLEQGIFLWGAGRYGIFFLHYLLRNGIKVKGFIDNDSAKTGTFCENIPIRYFKEVEERNANIFISVGSEQSIDEIKKQVTERYTSMKIYSLVDLATHPIVLSIL